MDITVHSSKCVKPAYAYAGAGDAPAAADVVPLTVFDKVNFDMYISAIYAFRSPVPPNAVLEAGLAKALAEYREYAGRLAVDGDGRRVIVLNDAGARFVEATADVALDAVTPLSPADGVVGRLHPCGDGAEELVLVQVTRFACGSVVVGTTAQHAVADGRASTNFFRAWSQATRGAAVDPVPVSRRASFFAPRDPSRVEFEHRGAEFKKTHGAHVNLDASSKHVVDDDGGGGEVVVHAAHFSREFIAALKSQASPPPHRYSTLQCVVAHLWRCITKARRLDVHTTTTTSLCIAVDGRARMRPPVPEGYTGNVVLWARPTSTPRDLVSAPLRHAVELISREVSRIGDGYFKSFIDFASSGAVEDERLTPMADGGRTVHSPDVEVNSWLRIPFRGMDFGGGPPLFGMPSYVPPAEGSVIVLPSFSWDGGVDAYVPLFRRDVGAFDRCCYSLADAGARL
ncbi:agmatine coumaroyltransferase-2-like [Oryza brachyantha]|uniref:agmatine coumaroyltransferase-2-like n=1 Tax=Oryza brachyantha TaxID=4533 RepID=UPI001ADB0BAC|nr:agmatine coumaroyltransferase-2-like [Oryza brachyantha]